MRSVRHLHARAVVIAPRGMPHYSLTKDLPVVLHIFAVGPSGINYANPVDDPRTEGKEGSGLYFIVLYMERLFETANCVQRPHERNYKV
jgi:hypothetical protein